MRSHQPSNDDGIEPSRIPEICRTDFEANDNGPEEHPMEDKEPPFDAIIKQNASNAWSRNKPRDKEPNKPKNVPASGGSGMFSEGQQAQPQQQQQQQQQQQRRTWVRLPFFRGFLDRRNQRDHESEARSPRFLPDDGIQPTRIPRCGNNQNSNDGDCVDDDDDGPEEFPVEEKIPPLAMDLSNPLDDAMKKMAARNARKRHIMLEPSSNKNTAQLELLDDDDNGPEEFPYSEEDEILPSAPMAHLHLTNSESGMIRKKLEERKQKEEQKRKHKNKSHVVEDREKHELAPGSEPVDFSSPFDQTEESGSTTKTRRGNKLIGRPKRNRKTRGFHANDDKARLALVPDSEPVSPPNEVAASTSTHRTRDTTTRRSLLASPAWGRAFAFTRKHQRLFLRGLLGGNESHEDEVHDDDDELRPGAFAIYPSITSSIQQGETAAEEAGNVSEPLTAQIRAITPPTTTTTVSQANDSDPPVAQTKRQRTRMWVLLIIGLLIIAGIVVGVVFSLGRRGNHEGGAGGAISMIVTPAPTTSLASSTLSVSPSIAATVCPATLLGFSDAVVSCNCNNTVDVPKEVLDQYVELIVLGFSESVIAGFNEQAGSCDPTNVALYWLAEDIIKTGNSNFQSRRTRYILAILFLRWTTSSRGVQTLSGWTRRDGWLSQTHECTWFGLSCENNSLVQMDLANNTLQLNVLADELFLLTDLKLINLAENSKFPSTIPTVISQLTRLEVLNLRGNAFTGVIPEQLFRVSSLRLIDIGRNNIGGSVSTEIAQLSNLEVFLADSNVLAGIPTQIANLTRLAQLDLSSNRIGGNVFAGGIPTQIANLTRLARLDLSSNRIGGNMPTQIWSLTSLEILDLAFTSLMVTLGPEMGAASSLQVLSLQGVDYRSTATIPTEIGMLTRLRVLNLQNPPVATASTLKLRSTLPTELGLLTDLVFLAFGSQSLFGTIPSEIGALTELEYLNLGNNMLDGSIPPEIMVLPRVVRLNLRNNNLEGSIPTIVNTPDLFCLDVSANDLTGSVPEALCDSTPVAVFLECQSHSDLCTCCSCARQPLRCFVFA